MRPGQEGTSVHPGLNSGDPMSSVGDITLSGMADGSSLLVRDSFASNRDSHGGSLTPSNGKINSIAHVTMDAATTSADVVAPDAVGASVAAPVPAETASQVVAEASASVSEVVDPSNLSIATTAAPQPASAESAASAPGFNSDPASASPEPSTLLLVGSMFFGFGAFRRKRST